MKRQAQIISLRFAGVLALFAALALSLLLLDSARADGTAASTASVRCDANPANDIAPPVDPDAGFVTGGGWLSVPANEPLLVWNQGFESGISGWCHRGTLWQYGYVTRVSSGPADILPASGGYHAIFDGELGPFRDGPISGEEPARTGPFSYNDGFRHVWTGGWTAQIDVYLDPAWPAYGGFAYSVAANGSDAWDQRDFIFNVYQNATGDSLRVSAAGSPNSDFFEIPGAGWYTLQHVFYDAGGVLAAQLNLLDQSGLLYSATLSNPADTIPDQVGGNRYSWFVDINVPGGIAVDNHTLEVIPTAGGRLDLNFVSRYPPRGDTPRGNARFEFSADGIDFRSSEYRWLAVDTAAGSAQFSGTGTVNRAMAPTGELYFFTAWVEDGNPDRLRVKIWWENNTFGRDPTVLFDNGALQVVSGGNIQLHGP